MLKGLAKFVESITQLVQVIKGGIAVGEMLADGDVSFAFGGLLSNAHMQVWTEALQSGTLNNGQYIMALECMDAGSEYLDNLGSASEWDPSEYESAMHSAAEGASSALSSTINKAKVSVSHVSNSTASGLSGMVMPA